MRKASKESADKNIKDKMYHIANQLRKGRKVSHHEAIMRVLSIPLMRSSKPVIFISTDYKEIRTRMLKPSSALKTLDDDDNDIYLPGIHEKYAARPSSLEHLCFAEISAYYVTASYAKKENTEELTECDAYQTGGVIKLRRLNPQVIKYQYIFKENDFGKYHHRLLLLYKPWKSEDDLIQESYTEIFRSIQSEIFSIIKMFEPFHEEVDKVIDNFDPEELLPEAWEHIATQTEQKKVETTFSAIVPEHNFLDPKNITAERLKVPKPSTHPFSLTSTVQHNDTYYYQIVTSLNEQQRQLFDFTYQWGVEIKLSQNPPKPF
ncbi:hypothetical protein MAR_025540 [Mya arenaria]|uniref:Uncharacterized protein n=1 Tax=Mya arenaria TaxID=6604 RepID=A0ABY7EMY9_MYAAR|nr:hypothetical protein MAR_025540 [Mya arenaria]